MKIVNHFTGKLAILSDNWSNDDDGGIDTPSCDYSIFPANEYLLKVLRKIVETHIKLRECFGEELSPTSIK